MNDRSVLFTVTNITLRLPSKVTLQLTFSETFDDTIIVCSYSHAAAENIRNLSRTLRIKNMLLDEIREKIRIKKEAVLADPNEKEEDKRFFVSIEKVFQNRDAILKTPKSVILGTLMAVGYPYSELRKIYDDLIAELNRVYKMVDPSELDRALDQLKQKD